jgi:hypothetical protein
MQERINISSSSSSSSRSSSPLILNHDNDIQQRPSSSSTSSSLLINPQQNDNNDGQIFYHPLMDCDGNLLPVHFLTSSEVYFYFTKKNIREIVVRSRYLDWT